MKNWHIQVHVGWRSEWAEVITKYLANRVKEVREDLGYSQRKLSNSLGRSNAYISQIESGDLDLSVLDVLGLSALSKKPIRFFLPLEEEEEGKILGDEWEILRQFRKIKDEHIRQAALKQIAQLAKVDEAQGKK